jgi:chromosomal replication initiation ATPase DnaA
VSIDYIQKVVCDYFDLPIELLKSKTRKREVVQARQIAMYFAKRMTKSSWPTSVHTAAERTTPPCSTPAAR